VSNWRRWRRIVALVVVSWLLIFSVAYSITHKPFRMVETGSMADTFPVGTLLFTRPEVTYGLGDVITFRREGEVVTHRIVARKGDTYTTQGDANRTPDVDPVPKADVIGQVKFAIPLLFWKSKNGLGFGLFFCFLMTAIVLALIPSDEDKGKHRRRSKALAEA